MTPKESKEMAKLVEESIVRKYGKDWRRLMVYEIQRAVVSHEALVISMSWRHKDVAISDVHDLARAAWEHIVPEPEYC